MTIIGNALNAARNGLVNGGRFVGRVVRSTPGKIGTGLATAGAMYAQTAPALPTGYTGISDAATATFDWAKGFKITVVIAVFIFALLKLARGR
jgi:hypothetical protein